MTRGERNPLPWKRLVLAAAVGVACVPAAAQQRPDPDFHYVVAQPAFRGERILAIDAGHHNFHSAEGRYRPFADLAAADGFTVTSLAGPFDRVALDDIGILVIANALDWSNVDHWALPTPSAFSATEIAMLHQWVEEGGALFIIADHMPFAGAATDLAAAFGFRFVNGYVVRIEPQSTTLRFRPELTSIGDQGVGAIGEVVTFTGQAFAVPDGAHSVLTLEGNHVALLPAVAGRFPPETTAVDVSGYSQGAVMTVGKGRLAVFGEAGAFTAQIDDKGRKFGMNAEGAEDNAPFALAILRWLARYR